MSVHVVLSPARLRIWQALHALPADAAYTIAELADHTRVGPPIVYRAVMRMRDAQYVARRPFPAGGDTLWALTAQGRAIADRLLATVAAG